MGYVNGFGAIFILSHFRSLILTFRKPHEPIGQHWSPFP